MDPEFWHARWRSGRIGFHQSRVTPLLERHWAGTGVPATGQVFVPLAGKSLDMAWLAARGHRVLGVELSRLAIEQFFADQDVAPTVRATAYGDRYSAGHIELICGDVFDLDARALAGCSGVFDRAALIALPADLRRRYVHGPYAALPGGCRGLLVTLEYPDHQKQGPPFSVGQAEVRSLFARDWHVDLLEGRDILDSEPGFAAEGVTRLRTSAYRIQRNA